MASYSTRWNSSHIPCKIVCIVGQGDPDWDRRVEVERVLRPSPIASLNHEGPQASCYEPRKMEKYIQASNAFITPDSLVQKFTLTLGNVYPSSRWKQKPAHGQQYSSPKCHANIGFLLKISSRLTKATANANIPLQFLSSLRSHSILSTLLS